MISGNRGYEVRYAHTLNTKKGRHMDGVQFFGIYNHFLKRIATASPEDIPRIKAAIRKAFYNVDEHSVVMERYVPLLLRLADERIDTDG